MASVGMYSENTMTGVLRDNLTWSEDVLHPAFSDWKYTGSIFGLYVGELDRVDSFAAKNQGLTKSQFRALPSAIRNVIRDATRSWFNYPIKPGYGDITAGLFNDRLPVDSVHSAVVSHWDDADPYGLRYTDGDLLLRGGIPELQAVGVSQDRIDAINYWWPRAATKMGWSKSTTAEAAKPLRRERGIKIETILKGMYDKRVAGYSIRKTIGSLAGG